MKRDSDLTEDELNELRQNSFYRRGREDEANAQIVVTGALIKEWEERTTKLKEKHRQELGALLLQFRDEYMLAQMACMISETGFQKWHIEDALRLLINDWERLKQSEVRQDEPQLRQPLCKVSACKARLGDEEVGGMAAAKALCAKEGFYFDEDQEESWETCYRQKCRKRSLPKEPSGLSDALSPDRSEIDEGESEVDL